MSGDCSKSKSDNFDDKCDDTKASESLTMLLSDKTFDIKVNTEEDTMDNIKETADEQLQVSNHPISAQHNDKLADSDGAQDCGFNQDFQISPAPSFQSWLPSQEYELKTSECLDHSDRESDDNNDDDDSLIGQNALLNDLVVKECVKYLGKQDLIVCRRVCSKWNENIIPRLRRTFQISFNFARGDGFKKLDNFLQLMQSSDAIPFGNFKLTNVPRNREVFDKFLSLCGPYIKRLKLIAKKSSRSTLDFWRYILFNVPSLETIKLRDDEDSPRNNQDLFLSWIVHQDKNIPKLTKLTKIQCNMNRLTKYNRRLLMHLTTAALNVVEVNAWNTGNVVPVLKEAGNFLKLRKLSLCRVYEMDLQVLIEFSVKGMRLIELNLDLCDYVEKESIEKLLSYHKDSLKKFELCSRKRAFSHSQKVLKLKLPVMVNLKIFNAPDFQTNAVLYEPIAFASQFPNLDELSLHNWDVHWDNDAPGTMNQISCTSLRELFLYWWLDDINQFKCLVNLFPCVNKFIICTESADIIPLIWQSWPNLESLTMFVDTRIEDLDDLFIHGRKRGSNMLDDYEAHPQYGICQLKRLKELKIIVTERPLSANVLRLLSDDFAYKALNLMPQLDNLYITKTQISYECYKNIRPTFSLLADIRIRDVYGKEYTI